MNTVRPYDVSAVASDVELKPVHVRFVSDFAVRVFVVEVFAFAGCDNPGRWMFFRDHLSGFFRIAIDYGNAGYLSRDNANVVVAVEPIEQLVCCSKTLLEGLPGFNSGFLGAGFQREYG